ncbi:MAG TPA: glycosyltransferase family 2 protein [Stellaceae bacterium]|nr:glycosyltransferase family 2 protein [Stellaceae bacterium]
MELSVVIPVKNEAGNIAPLVGEIAAALDGLADYEIVYVDDGSTDATAAEIRALQQAHPRLRLIRHAASCGQSAAVRTGIRAARGGWIATLDGDGQNDPADIPALWRLARAAPPIPPLLIAGHRAKRRDTWSKRLSSRVANGVRRRMLRDDTPDTGCGLKLFPRALFLDLPYFDHMHRFLPALVLRAGGAVRSVPVNHRPRERGASKYGTLDRLAVGITDLFGVMWLRRRSSLPVVSE